MTSGAPEREPIASLVSALSAAPLDRLALVTVQAPPAPLEALWADDGEAALLWSSPGGRALAGVGETLVVAAEGAARFARVGEAARALAGAHATRHPDAPPVRPALVGGFAFAVGGASGSEWAPFGDARFALPRWTYERHPGGGATLTLALGPGESRGLGTLGPELEVMLGRLESPRPGPRFPRIETHAEPFEAWSAMVGGALAEIGAGRLRKVVLARRIEVRSAAPLPVPAMLARQCAEAEDAYRFAFRVAGRTFLGASPELLVARRGRDLESEALAGTISGDESGGGRLAEFVSDPKQREEHAIVVEAIRARLAPLCETLSVPDRPEVRPLRQIAHLRTPIVGRLRGDVPLVELAASLHPTPAVGGEPSAEACSWIARHEPAPRGWYAGPVGLVEAGGDGVLAVALRGALVHCERARVWAGAGIVAGSTPGGEYEETGMKARSALAALGLGD
ncbi:MAG: isochorismate synthase [Acidobacteriota bacterium]